MDRYQEMERRFAACYQRHGKHSVRVLLEFYRGQYHKFLLSTLFFLLKHSPALLSPLLIANVVNGVIEGGEAGSRAIFINVGIIQSQDPQGKPLLPSGNGGNQRKGDGDGRNGSCRQGSCPGG